MDDSLVGDKTWTLGALVKSLLGIRGRHSLFDLLIGLYYKTPGITRDRILEAMIRCVEAGVYRRYGVDPLFGDAPFTLDRLARACEAYQRDDLKTPRLSKYEAEGIENLYRDEHLIRRLTRIALASAEPYPESWA